MYVCGLRVCVAHRDKNEVVGFPGAGVTSIP